MRHSEQPSADRGSRVLTVPNALVAARLAGTGVLAWLAWAGHGTAFVWLLAALLLTDWLDGKLAILLRQRTRLGARLDSAADVVLYAVLIPCAWWLRPELLRQEWILVAAAAATWGVSAAAGLVRFGRLPAYHTRAAKVCWFLIAVGAVTAFAGASPWPLRIALAAVALTNLEATAVSLVLPAWETDVPSLYHALRRRRET